jgi:hypothetical protein
MLEGFEDIRSPNTIGRKLKLFADIVVNYQEDKQDKRLWIRKYF